MTTPDPSTLQATCRCGTELWAERAGEWTLAQRIVKLTDVGIVALCPKCREEVPVPWLHVAPAEVPTPTRRRMVMRSPT